MKKWTLQTRLTFIVGIILLSVCVLLTTNALFSAHTYYGNYAALIESGQVEIDPILMDENELILEDPSEFYREASQKFSMQSLVFMIFIVLLAVGCTYLIAGQILSPLKKLTESVQEVNNDNLDKRISTEGIQGEMLELANSFNGMLERLEESFLIQKSFAANAAHELKTPLAIIKTSLQVLEMSPQPTERDYQEFMSDTNESLGRIIKTVEGLLALASMESAAVSEHVDLRPLLEQVIQELSGQAEMKGVSLSIVGDGEVVYGNSSLLYRAFFNLIENAIKYNRLKGTVVVTMEQDRKVVRIRVEDTGLGISKNALPHIFESFYREDSSRSQEIPGSGMGLAIVKMILERHDAVIKVTSETNKGTVFVIELKK